MGYSYPAPQDVGIRIPRHLIGTRYKRGFRHALEGKQLSAVEHFKLSFREGFRAGKGYARDLRRARGILDFPLRAKIKIVSVQ
jgi:hypothetical protein